MTNENAKQAVREAVSGFLSRACPGHISIPDDNDGGA
jgi:hypothetical protein